MAALVNPAEARPPSPLRVSSVAAVPVVPADPEVARALPELLPDQQPQPPATHPEVFLQVRAAPEAAVDLAEVRSCRATMRRTSWAAMDSCTR